MGGADGCEAEGEVEVGVVEGEGEGRGGLVSEVSPGGAEERGGLIGREGGREGGS